MKRRTIILLVMLVFVIGGAVIGYSLLGAASNSGQQGTGGTQAPDFLIYDADGNEITLEDFKGKPLVINFWASWCGPCKSEMEGFNNQYNKLGEDVEFVMVNLTDGRRETVESAQKFIMSEGYNFPVYFDKDMTATDSYQAYSIPTTYFIDSEGMIAGNVTGALNEYALSEGIKLIYRNE